MFCFDCVVVDICAVGQCYGGGDPHLREGHVELVRFGVLRSRKQTRMPVVGVAHSRNGSGHVHGRRYGPGKLGGVPFTHAKWGCRLGFMGWEKYEPNSLVMHMF